MSLAPVVSTPIIRIFKSATSDHVPVVQRLSEIVQIRLIWRVNSLIEHLIIPDIISTLTVVEMMTMTCAVK